MLLSKQFMGRANLLLPLILLLSVCSVPLFAVAHFKTVSINDGLSQNSINGIIQDQKGFIWIATQDGLNRFDGYRFKIFKFDPNDTSTISDNYIVAMIQDSRGRLWLGTEEGLNEYDTERERFIRYFATDDNSPGLSHNHVTALYEAPSRPGEIWIGTERGLDRLETEPPRFSSFAWQEVNSQSIPHDYIQYFYEAPSIPGILWIATRSGLSRLKLDSGKIDCVFNGDVKVLYEAPSLPGVLWIGTATGLVRMDLKTEQFTPVSAKGLQSVHVNALIEAGSSLKTLWIGLYGGGIALFSLETGEIKETVLAGSDRQSLSDNFILNFFEDRSGLLWVGTQLGGICQFSPQTRNFLLYRNHPGNENSLSHRTVRAVCESGRMPGKVWVGTYGGLDLLDKENGQVSHFRHRPGSTDGPGSELIRAVLEDRQGRLWVGTQDAGISILSSAGTAWTHYRQQFGKTDTIRCFLQDSDGKIWIGTAGAGLCRYEENENRFFFYRNQENETGGISGDRVYSLFEDSQGRIWAGTSDGLNCLDRFSGHFTVFRNDSQNPGSLSNNMVMSLHQDKTGVIWAGTWGGGLNRFHEQEGRFDHYTENEGLANNVVYGILEDVRGRLWLSTNNGLSCFDPQTIQFRNYDVTDGLQSNEFNANAHHQGHDGLLYFGGINGLNVFYPAAIKESPYRPQVVITDFQIDNRSVPIGPTDDAHALLSKSIVYSDTLKLSYRDLILTFEYSALSFIAPEKNNYAYMMEGLERNWNYVGSRRFVTYTNVPPGKYRFRVKGANHDGFWNDTGTGINLIIDPPFWQTVWFRIFFVFILLFLAQTLLALRTRSLRHRKRILEQLVRERTQELTRQNEALERLSLVARHTDNGVLIMDARGDVEWINEGFTRMYGYSYDQLLKECGQNMVTISHREDFATIFKECLQSKTPVVYENLCYTRTGVKKWAQTVLNPILDHYGRVVKLILIDSDITLLKEANERAETERFAAEEANKAKSNFLARMSHEIRTPMNGVIGFTDMLLDTTLTPEQRDFLYTIKNCGESLLYLINDILDFSKIEAGNMAFEQVDFHFEQMICESCEIVAPRAEFKDVELVCRISDDVPTVIRSDPLRLRQVLINLLDNAIKFSEKGVVELIVAGSQDSEGLFSLEMSVKDSGPGIPFEKQSAIFNAFTQADETICRRHGGTGLGLAICKQIAEQMGGDISLVSEPGQGSVFTFSARVCLSSVELPPIIPETSLAGKRALIVDDNNRNLMVLRHILQSHGMDVEAVSDPARVVPQLLNSLSEKPFDICIIDILMPKMDGFALASQIRHLASPLAQLPLLAYSSSISSQVGKYRKAGFSAFLTKPIQKGKLLRTIYSLLVRGEYAASVVEEVGLNQVRKNHGQLAVLLVEDNAINRKLMERVLSKLGHKLTMADNGLEAIEQIEQNPSGYDLIFMDIHMPVMDGLEATRRIRERGYDKIPIIALTADSMKGDREKCLNAGMNDYLSKPFNKDDLMRIVRKWGR